jgi:hypothetical protein
MKNIVLILFLSQAGDPGASLFVFGMVKTASRHASRPASQNPPLAGDQLRWPPALSLIPERRHGVAVPTRSRFGMFPTLDAEWNPAL